MKQYIKYFWFKSSAEKYQFDLSRVCKNVILEKQDKLFKKYKVYVND